MRIYSNAGFSRVAGTGEGSSSAAVCRVDLHHDHDHNAALMICNGVGADTCGKIATRLKALEAEEVACVCVDLPMADPNVFVHGADLHRLGFAFGCILPEAREDGDVLRLQHFGGKDPDTGEIATSSDFGQSLLASITASCRRVAGPRVGFEHEQ